MKKLLFIALLALMVLAVVPASASYDDTSNLLGNPAAGCIWHNGKCYAPEDYAKLIKGSTVIHNSRTGVDSKYKDTNPAKSVDVWAGKGTCTLEGNVRAGYNTLTKEVEIRNVNQDANESGTIIPIQPDGTFRYDGLAAGDYVLRIIAPFEGVGPDQYSKLHCERGVARPESELLGYAITTESDIEEVVSDTPDITICKALYYPNPEKKPISGHCIIGHTCGGIWHTGVANVRAAVQALVDDGHNTFTVSNDNLGGDPAYGWYKKLSVVYTTEGKTCKKPCNWQYASAEEYQQITLL